MLIPTATVLTLVVIVPEISGQMFPFSNLWHYFNGNGKTGGGGLRGILSGGHKTNDLETASTSEKKLIHKSGEANGTTTPRLWSETISTVIPRNTVTFSPQSTPTEYNSPKREKTSKKFADSNSNRDPSYTFLPTWEITTRLLPTKPAFASGKNNTSNSGNKSRNELPADKRYDVEPEKSPSNDYNSYIDVEDYNGDPNEEYRRKDKYDERNSYNEESVYDDKPVVYSGPHTSEPFYDYESEVEPGSVEEKLVEARKKSKPVRGQDQIEHQREYQREREYEGGKQKNRQKNNQREELELRGDNYRVPDDRNRNSQSRPNSENSELNSKADLGIFEQPVYVNPFDVQPQSNPFRVNGNGYGNNDGYMKINYLNPISTPNPYTTTAFSIVPLIQAQTQYPLQPQQEFTAINHFEVNTKRIPANDYDDTNPFKLDWNLFNNSEPPASKPIVVYDPQQSSFTAPYQIPVHSGGNLGLNFLSPNGHSHSFESPKSNVDPFYQQVNPNNPQDIPLRVLATVRPVHTTPQPLVALTTTSPPHADYPVTHVIKYSKENPFFPFLESPEEPIIESLPAISFALNEHKKAQHLEKDDVVDYLTPPKLELPPAKHPKLKPKKKKLSSRRNKNYKAFNKESDSEEEPRRPVKEGRKINSKYNAMLKQYKNTHLNKFGDHGDGEKNVENFEEIAPQAWVQDDGGIQDDEEERENSEEEDDGERRPDDEEYDECPDGNGNCDNTETDYDANEEEEEEEEEQEVEQRPPRRKNKLRQKAKEENRQRYPVFDPTHYPAQNPNEHDEEAAPEEDDPNESEIKESIKNHKYRTRPEKNHRSPIKKNFKNSRFDSGENYISPGSFVDNHKPFLRTRRPDSRGIILGGSDFNNHRLASFSKDDSVPFNGSLIDSRVKKSNDEEFSNHRQDSPSVPNFANQVDFDSGFSGESSESESLKGGSAGDRVEFQMHGQSGPDSYKFGFDTGKGDNRQFRYEEKENDGTVKGHYGYYDQNGKLHVINYAAHPEHGFQAEPAT